MKTRALFQGVGNQLLERYFIIHTCSVEKHQPWTMLCEFNMEPRLQSFFLNLYFNIRELGIIEMISLLIRQLFPEYYKAEMCFDLSLT